MLQRIDIERALEGLASDEGGFIFQGLAVVLAKQRWPELIASERKKDRGLDAHAAASLSPDGRGKGLACSITGTFDKVKDDAIEVEKHYPDVSVLIFYTSEKVSQGKKAEWAQKIRDEYGYELIVVSREDIIASLQLPDNAYLCATHLKISVPYQPSSATLLHAAREAAAAVAAQWAAHPRLAGKPSISLNAVVLDRKGNETREVFPTAHLRTELLQGRRFILEAPAGRGKTTTLIQLAQATGGPQPITFLVDLPGWVRSPATILEHIARMPAFLARGIDTAALARLAHSEPCLFLLNGWNEISSIHSQDAANALCELERAFPAAGIIVATRAHDTVPPLPGSTRIRLLPLTPTQRFNYLAQAIGDRQAHQFDTTLSGDRVLNELTRTPLILSEVTTLFRSGREIPRTKFALLGAVLDLMEQSADHASHLQGQPLWGHAEDYLRGLAIDLTAKGEVVVGEAEARTICHTVAERLKSDKQHETLPEPADILRILCAHHILERIEYPGTGFRFEHQQFQEYYAALMLRVLLAELVTTPGGDQREAFGKRYVNEPAWDAPLFMVAEEIGVANGNATLPANVEAASLLVENALRVDPLFAARLAFLCGSAVSPQSRHQLGQRLRSIYATADPHYRQIALASMLATGSDDFADILIPLLTCADQQIRLRTYRAGPDFHPSSLGPRWQQIVGGWQEEMRGEFISELAMHRGRFDVASVFADSDPSGAVRARAIRALAWVGQYQEVAELLQVMTDSEFQQMLGRLGVDDLPPNLYPRAISGYKTILAETTDPKARFQIALTLMRLRDIDSTNRLKEELNGLPTSVVKELSDYSLGPAIVHVRQIDPQWVSQWVGARIIEGALWRDNWLSLVLAIPESQREDLLQRVCSENLQYGSSGRIISLLAATADASFAGLVFDKLCDHRRQLLEDPRSADKQAIDQQLRNLFKTIPAQQAVEGLEGVLAKKPDGLEFTLIIEMFSRMGSVEDSLRGVLPEALRQRLCLYLKAAAPTVIDQEDLRGEVKARLATALAEVGNPEDMADLLALIRADIERVRRGRAALARGDRSAGQGAMMSYSNWHVQALVWLDRTQAIRYLLDLLNESEYELDAAWALVTLARKEPGDHLMVTGRFGSPGRDCRALRNAPAQSSTTYDAARRIEFAAAIKGRVISLLGESQTGDHKTVPYYYRLKELTKALATLDATDSADLILEIAELPANFDGWRRIDLLEALLFGGVTLYADKVIGLLEPIFDQFRKQGVYNNDSLSLLNRILHLLPFVEPPARGIAKIRELSTEFHLHPHNHRDLLMALGQCKCAEGLAFLRDLASQTGAGFQQIAREWFESVASSPLPDAKTLLLSSIDPDVTDGIGDFDFPDYTADHLAGLLANIANADTAVAERLLHLTNQPISAKRRQILAKIVVRLDAAQPLATALNLIDDTSPQPIPYELWRALEDVFLEKRPYKGNPQSYTLVPRAAGDIKKRLFEMAENDPRRTRSARSLLGQIEGWRLEHGRPSSEPRHPSYDSGKPWPPSITSSLHDESIPG
jgi:HEAT repeat protein